MISEHAAIEKLNGDESAELLKCKKTVSSGLQVFYKVGDALMSILNSRLYRETHTSFIEFCKDEWGMSGSRARQLCDAAKVVKNITGLDVQTLNVSTTVDTPSSEAVTRPLTSLTEEQQKKAWNEAKKAAAKEGRKANSKDTKKAADTLVPPKPKPQPPQNKQRARGGLASNAMNSEATAAPTASYDAYTSSLTKPSPQPAPVTAPLPNPVLTPETAPVETGPRKPADIVRACYARHKAAWNQVPPPAPSVIIETIIKELEASSGL